MPGKRLSRTGLIGQRGIALIEDIVLAMKCVWYPSGTPLEAGIDGYIELVDPATSEMLNLVVQVQSKATEEAFQAETDTSFEFRCDARDIDYWLGGNAHVILIRSRPKKREAYWKCVTTWFADPDVRASRKIVFDKEIDRFDATARDRLFEIAADKRKGLYLDAQPRSEDLVSNLLRVESFPAALWLAPTGLESHAEVSNVLKGFLAGPEFVVRDRSLISFHDLTDPAWREVCDQGSVEKLETAEWAASEDASRQREFVELLNLGLRAMTRADLEWHWRREILYFRATDDFKTRYLGDRAVFKAYPLKKDRSRIAYYRHSAFEPRFLRADGVWYLAISPTYYFTNDGAHTSRSNAKLLTKIKQLERNDAVRQQTEMWARYLRAEHDLLTDLYPFVEFANELERFEVEFGLDDDSWRSRDPLGEQKSRGAQDSLLGVP